MDDHSKSAMIALLPIVSNWCHIDLPHMTLVYAGEINKLSPTAFNTLAKDASSLSMISNSLMLKVLGIEIFGDQDKVDVLRFQPSAELLAMRRFVEKWNASDFPFNPHATIGPTGVYSETPPNYVAFDRIMVSWGNDNLTFYLKK